MPGDSCSDCFIFYLPGYGLAAVALSGEKHGDNQSGTYRKLQYVPVTISFPVGDISVRRRRSASLLCTVCADLWSFFSFRECSPLDFTVSWNVLPPERTVGTDGIRRK